MANEITICRLTAKKTSPSAEDLTRPEIFDVKANDLRNIRRNKGEYGSVFEKGFKPAGQSSVQVYETPSQIRANINLTAGVTGGLYDAGEINLGVAGAGSTLAAATQLATYFNKVSAVTATSADGVKLGASPSIGDVMVVLNAASAAVDVFPNTATSWIDNLAVSAVKSVAVGQSVHFVCKVAGASAQWQSATDENNA
jgi:hypothetical protein